MKNFKIMVTDDDPITRELIKYVIQSEGFEVITAENGNDCIEKMRTQSIDLLILDFYMDEMDGLDVLKILRNNCDYKGFVIMCTSSAEKQNVKRFITEGIDSYIFKPIDSERLITTVNNLLNIENCEKKNEIVEVEG